MHDKLNVHTPFIIEFQAIAIYFLMPDEATVSNGLAPPDVLRTPVVLVADHDIAMRDALSALIRSMNRRLQLFGTAAELLHSPLSDAECCIVLDVRLPGVNGLDFQVYFRQANVRLPIIFISVYGDIAMTVRAMKNGAVDFLAKPFRDQDLLDAVGAALMMDCRRTEREALLETVRARIATLFMREREVMAVRSRL